MQEEPDEEEEVQSRIQVYEPTDEEKAILYEKVDIGEDEDWRNYAIRGNDLFSMEFQPKKPIIDGLLPEGSLTILAGAPKAGKSWLTLDMASSVATGRPIIDDNIFDVPESGEVLVLALEDTHRRVKDRLELMYDNRPDNMKNLFVVTESPRMDEGGLKRIIGWLQDDEVKNPKMIVIDTLFHFRPGKTLGGGYANDALSLVTLHKLAQKANVAIVVVTHDIKSKVSPWYNSILGSKGLTGIADSVMLLRREERKKKGRLFYMGRDIEEDRLSLEFDRSTARWVKDTAPDDPGEDDEFAILPSGQLELVTHVMAHPEDEPFQIKDFVAATGKSPASIKYTLKELQKKGFIKSGARGMYALTPKYRNPQS